MRSLGISSAILLAAAPVQAASIGEPVLRDGVAIAAKTMTGLELDRLPAGMSRSADAVFLVADVHVAKDGVHGFSENAFIPYLSISYALTKDGAPTFKKAGLLYPVAAKSGPHYAASADMAGPGIYHLTYIVSPPSSRGMIRQTDKTGGVPDWWKPITVQWTFTYAGNAQ
ncbi:MAG TPA: iron transporter [Rhizomicrobium sp.]|nr:iron transporter [Rhizomicrobium sp.]